MSFAIRYFRDEETCKRFAEHGRLFKSIGWALTKDRYTSKGEAQKHVNHINAQQPASPAYVLPSEDPSNRSTFRTITRWL